MKRALIIGAVAVVAAGLGFSFVQTGNEKTAQAQSQSKSAQPSAQRQGVQLTETVIEGLVAAEPVRGKAVDREMFNGKPLLVVFFASW